ncbi:MAG: YebC/PmpR family DNA-binding transcriptional regulator [Myxococcota bacterium]
MGRMFEKRKHKMFARWDRMAKAFTRVGKEIAIAVKAGGENPDHNPALRRAIQNARAVNMPKDRVESAIAKASDNEAEDYQELIYEGYAPHGIALLIETATDNPTRTIANIRLCFKKSAGNIGSTGSVAFMFEKQGVFKLNPEGLDLDELELELIDHGLQELEHDEDDEGNAIVALRCAFNDFGNLQAAIEERGIEPISANSEYVPNDVVELEDDEALEEVLGLVEKLEQDDDVQRVYHTLA